MLYYIIVINIAKEIMEKYDEILNSSRFVERHTYVINQSFKIRYFNKIKVHKPIIRVRLMQALVISQR